MFDFRQFIGDGSAGEVVPIIGGGAVLDRKSRVANYSIGDRKEYKSGKIL